MGLTAGSFFVGTPAVQGPTLPSAAPLPGPTSGLFGTAGSFSSAQTLSTTSAISTGVGAFSTLVAGDIRSSQFDTQAGSQELQAEVVKLNAVEQGNALKRQLLQDLGAATASAAARGLDVGSGTPRDIVEESIGNVKRDVAKLEAGAQINITGAKTSAARSRAAGAGARLSSSLRATQSLVSFGLSEVL